MEDEKRYLRMIAMDYLYDGMIVTDDIFNFDGKVLLLAKGIILTQAYINQLRKFNSNSRNISVSENTYKDLISRSAVSQNVIIQDELEAVVGYTEVKDKMNDFLSNIRSTNLISRPDTELLLSKVSQRVHEIDPSLIFQCINAPNPIDDYLCRHSVNVGLINGLFGKWLGLDEKELDLLILSGIVHDVGKTRIPTEIINAPRRLSISEFEVIKMHPLYSYGLLTESGQFEESILLASRHHHEKMNGSGYPDGIFADQISLFARITSVSDIYDAMVSKRVYKEAANPFDIISQLSGKQFSELDISLVSLFTQNMPLELLNKPVMLTDGSVGTVKFIVANNLQYPLVEIDGEIKETNKDFHCVRMILDDKTFEAQSKKISALKI